MGCGCGKANAPVEFVYTPADSNKSPVTYGKEVLARAAQIRDGGGGSITVVAKG